MIVEKKDKNQIEDVLGSKGKIKILKLLAKMGELNLTLIISKTKLNHSSVLKHLLILEEANLVQEKRFGRIRIYRYKNENLKARYFKKLLEIWEREC